MTEAAAVTEADRNLDVPFSGLDVSGRDAAVSATSTSAKPTVRRSRTASSLFRFGRGSRANSSSNVVKAGGYEEASSLDDQASLGVGLASVQRKASLKSLASNRGSKAGSIKASNGSAIHSSELLASFRQNSGEALPASRRLSGLATPKASSTSGSPQASPSLDSGHFSSLDQAPTHAHLLGVPANVNHVPEDSHAHTHSPLSQTDTLKRMESNTSQRPPILRSRTKQVISDFDRAVEASSSEDEAYASPDEFFDAPEDHQSLRDLPAISYTPATSANVSSRSDSGASITSSNVASSSTSLATLLIPIKRPHQSLPVVGESPLRADIRQTWYAVSLFLNGQMKAAEKVMHEHRKDRLYYSLGYSLINAIKAMMTFEPADLGQAIDLCRTTLDLANKEKSNVVKSWTERIGSAANAAVKGSGLSVDQVRRMSDVQKHAELAYAECLLLKAVVGLMYAGDFMAFVKEAFNMRTAHAIYRILGRYIEERDATGANGYDETIDLDFRSGVSLGTGCVSLILSLLPSSAGRIMELFGFAGNRAAALKTLMDVGGWRKGQKTPDKGIGPGNEGLRRCVCDLMLLMYHLIISTVMPVSDVDIELAENILAYNLERYPNGVFWLYFSGRLHAIQTNSKRAIAQYHKAIESEKEYRQIQHIVNWDLGLTYLSTGQYEQAHSSFDILAKESNWSKAVYAYMQAITLYESGLQRDGKTEDEQEEWRVKLREIMAVIPGHMQKIAGKSLPFEKYVARKSRRFLAQGCSLSLPGLELGYIFQALPLAPRSALHEKHLPQIQSCAKELDANKEGYESWWDDYALALLLKAVVLTMIARPESHAKPEPADSPISVAEADAESEEALETIVANSHKLTLDHHLAWYAHFELGRLLVRRGGHENLVRARGQFTTIIEGKVLLGPSKGKGKVSLQSGIVLKTNAALEDVKKQLGESVMR